MDETDEDGVQTAKGMHVAKMHKSASKGAQPLHVLYGVLFAQTFLLMLLFWYAGLPSYLRRVPDPLGTQNDYVTFAVVQSLALYTCAIHASTDALQLNWRVTLDWRVTCPLHP